MLRIPQMRQMIVQRVGVWGGTCDPNSLMSAGVMGLYVLPLQILAKFSPSVMNSSESGRVGGDTLRSCSGQQHPARPAEALKDCAAKAAPGCFVAHPCNPWKLETCQDKICTVHQIVCWGPSNPAAPKCQGGECVANASVAGRHCHLTADSSTVWGRQSSQHNRSAGRQHIALLQQIAASNL